MKKFIISGILVLTIFQLHAQTAEPQPSSVETVPKTRVDSAELYGLIPQRPVKVGGGPAEQQKYLESLRDAQEKKITYYREGSCCPYPSTSPEAISGGGMLDIYVINYRDAANKKKTIQVYITFYEYEEPKPVKGFSFK